MGREDSSLVLKQLPWITKLKLLIIAIFLRAILRPNSTLNRRLVSLVEFNAKANPNTINGVRTTDFSIDPSRGLSFRLFFPATPAASLPVVIFFHGGGFAFLSAEFREYDAVCRRFCKELGAAVVSVNYRRSPEHRFPAQYDDGVDVLRFLEFTLSNFFIGKGLLREFFQAADLSRCFLAGDSAGANIAHHVARRWSAGGSRHLQLAGLIAVQPFFGGEARVPSEIRLPYGPLVSTDRTDWLWNAFLPDGATRDHPAANPVAAVENLSKNFPPVMVMGGEHDPLLDWQRKYFWSLLKNGKEAEMIVYPGSIHAFYFFPELKGSAALTDDMRSFILRQSCRRRRGGPPHVAPQWERAKVNMHG